jgi:hypothetical protein
VLIITKDSFANFPVDFPNTHCQGVYRVFKLVILNICCKFPKKNLFKNQVRANVCYISLYDISDNDLGNNLYRVLSHESS